MYPNSLIDEFLENSKGGLDNAANNFQWALINGLESFKPKIKLITAPALGSYPNYYKKPFIRSRYFSYGPSSNNILVGFMNMPLINHLTKTVNLAFQLNQLNSFDNSVIFVYSVHSPFLSVACRLKQNNRNLKICLIVPDLPQYMSGNNNPIYRLSKKIDNYFINKYLKNIDFFVLLTEAMKEPLKVGQRPYLVMEGIYNGRGVEKKAKDVSQNTKKDNNQIIFYSGSLSSRYGILNLLEAFKAIKSESYKLWLCGSGNAVDLIKEAADKDSRIKFFGYLAHNKILTMQKKATVLINPRTSEGEFTKYSFPSKNIEYLASGTPTILHKLKGIPDEYYKYCFIAEEQSPKGLKNKIVEVCEMDSSELYNFGQKARNFIIKNKNNVAQVDRILSMINANLNSNNE